MKSRKPCLEHAKTRGSKRTVKSGPRMTRKERVEYVRRLLKENPKAPN